MEDNKPLSPFQEVHRKIQERLAYQRESQEKDSELRKKREEEVLRHRFDRDYLNGRRSHALTLDSCTR